MGNPGNKARFDKGIDAYVLEEMLPLFKYIVSGFTDLAQAVPAIRVTRYEGMVTDFDNWADSYFEAMAFNPAILGRFKSTMAHHFDNIETENIDAHKRQILTPISGKCCPVITAGNWPRKPSASSTTL